MADNRIKAKDPRAARRNSDDSLHTSKGINGDDGHSQPTKASAKRNYKLLIDPAIKKGHQKIYRFDGVFPGQPPVVPRDPRPPRTKLWTATVADLPIPRFKVDKYYVGTLPQNTIRFGCLNDNINRQFLRELCTKFGKIEECKVYYDIKSKKHLGTGKITFTCASAARQAVAELDGTSVMGNIIRVSIERKKNAQAKNATNSKDPREFRDPRRSNSGGSTQQVLPTPSPSQYSPSVESTPPTPLIGSMNRAHPVAGLRVGLYGRRCISVDTDATPLESPASICSASFNSATFEPISPPPVSRFRSLPSDSGSFPPPPPPDKTSCAPPPPPPSKQEIYEDISPTANFDEDSKSPSSSKAKKGKEKKSDREKDTYVQAHLLGLKIACGAENCKKRDHVDAHKHHKHHGCYRSPNQEADKGNLHAKKEDKQFSSSREEFTPEKSSSSRGGHSTSRRNAGESSAPPYQRETATVSSKASAEANDSKFARRGKPGHESRKPQNESVYEAISDSDEEDKGKPSQTNNFAPKNLHVEDISPANSPVSRNSINGPSTKELSAAKGAVEAPEVVVAEESTQGEKEMEIDDDDDDDAMSLSSISSNEESAMVLNTPVTRIQVPVVSSSGNVSFSALNVFANSRPGITMARPPCPPSSVVAPPPVNLSAPPHVNVAPPPQINMPPVNVHQPPMNVQQPTMITRLPPPPPVNIRVPPPGHLFNQTLPQPHAQQQQRMPPYGPPPGPPPPARQSQPLSTFPPQSVTGGGFIGSFSRPYSGFFPSNYPNYQKYKQRERPVAEVVKEVPYEDKVRNSCTRRTKKDLKLVLRRDLIKRLVEHSGFSALEAWWDNQTKKKDTASTSSRSVATANPYASPLTQTQADSPANLTTSSLLSSLFRRSHQPSLSASYSSPTSSHTSVAKIPSFRINRIPQARPVAREPAAKRFKKEAQRSEYEVANKVRRVEESSDEERTVKEEESESESESDNEVDKTLFTSRRPTVQSGSSLYQSIYKSSSEEKESAGEDRSDESDKDDDEDEEDRFKDLVNKQKLMRKNLTIKDKQEEDQLSVEGEETMSEEEDEDEEEVEEAEESEDEEEVTDDEAEDDESMDEGESEWESSGAEEAVKEVIKETEKRLEQFKEKSVKKQVQEKKFKEHEIMMVEYLKRRNDHAIKEQDDVVLQDKSKMADKDVTVEHNKEMQREDKLQGKPEARHPESDHVLSAFDQLNKENIRQSKGIDGLMKGNKDEKITEIVEETIEETQISTKVSSELAATEIKEELISEEVIEEIEPDDHVVNEEVFNEHSYASKTALEQEDGHFQEDMSSPIIDVVDVVEDLESKTVFPMRSIEDEKSIVLDILEQGIDSEDLKYLKSAFESLHGFGSSVVKDLHWSHHPETQIHARQKRWKSEATLRVHKTGCARSEGYYKIPYSEKAQYLSSVMRHLEAMNEKVDKDTDGLKHKQQSRDNRAMQRRLVSAFVNDDFGDLVKFNKLKTRKKNLKFAKSGIHNWGLFTCEPIAAEEMVIEYIGESVRSVIADSREKQYEQRGIGSSYMFRLDVETVIDATKVGNNARFINHSCTPNCYAKIINVENEKKIVIYSKGDIKMNDEITYDYKFPIEEDKIECLCGTPQCRGTLN